MRKRLIGFGLGLAILSSMGAQAYELRCHSHLSPPPGESFLPPIVNQTTDYTCGPACLESAIEYFLNVSPGEKRLTELANPTEEDGTSPDVLARVTQEFGLRSHVHENISVSDLKGMLARKALPVLFLRAWGEMHWVLVVQINQDSVYLMDPWVKKAYPKMTFAELLDRWQGHFGTRFYMRTAVEISKPF